MDHQTVAPITATPTAVDAVTKLRQLRGSLVFYQSGGCCGGSLPMCFDEGEFRIGDNDVLLGFVVDCPFYIDPRQYERWKHTQLILDVGEGEPQGFSLGPADGWHFITRSRVFSPEERVALEQGGIP
jgi:uncharacterized protein